MTGKRSKLIDCIINGHNYTMIEDVTKKLNEDWYYVKCIRCGDKRKIHDKVYYDRKEGNYKL